MSDAAQRYNLGFTAASLRPDLSTILAENYLQTGDWAAARTHVLATNALQSRSASSAIRMERELRQRLQTLTRPELTLLAQGTAEDRAAIAWLAACKHIAFVYDFAADVLREKLASHDPILRSSDYEAYVEHQARFHPELSRLAVSSRNKLRQVLLRMIYEAGLLQPGSSLGTIQRPVLSAAVTAAVSSDNPNWLRAFLVPASEMRSCVA